MESFDTIIVVTPKDFLRLKSNYKYLIRFLPSDKLIFIGNEEVGRLVCESEFPEKVAFINENNILPFEEVYKALSERLKEILNGRELSRAATGWYYQQFLKMEYANYSGNEYYMSWDGDTVPCKEFSMFKEDGSPFMDIKHENHELYFETMGKLIPGLKKFIEASFISERMLEKSEYSFLRLQRIQQKQITRNV